MFPGFFKKPKEKLLVLNKIYNSKIPLEVVGIIKNYAFYNVESVVFFKKISTKKKELDLIKMAWSRNNLLNCETEERFPDEYPKRIREKSPRWFFGFTYDNIPPKNLFIYSNNLKLQGENCLKCGEYTYLCYSYKPHLHSKIGVCFCE